MQVVDMNNETLNVASILFAIGLILFSLWKIYKRKGISGFFGQMLLIVGVLSPAVGLVIGFLYDQQFVSILCSFLDKLSAILQHK